MPDWTLASRRITIGWLTYTNACLVKAVPDETIDVDETEHLQINTPEELSRLCPINVAPGKKWQGALWVSDLLLIKDDGPHINNLPAFEMEGLAVIAESESLSSFFSIEDARKTALDLWNTEHYMPGEKSFIRSLQIIFRKFEHLIKRRRFLERRIHRYVRDYAQWLLPAHLRCFYEHEVRWKEEKRKADFILQNEDGMPALLIELENPCHKLFNKNGEFSPQANHAKNQIAEWVKIIDEDDRNREEQMAFLSGPKRRLVILGRGLENIERMVDSKHTDTTMWTYNMLIKQAKTRWNGIILEQCRLIGIANPNLLR